ncbi:hypothetical protein BDV12DRAFT_206234 [Aspergillus spectabilis]
MSTKVTYKNPISPVFSPDPSVVFVNGTFYLVNSSFHIFPALPIYASRDLRRWTHIGNAINRPDQLNLTNASMVKMPLDTGKFMVGAGGLFAPTIRYIAGDIWSGEWSDPIYIPFHGIDPSLYFDDDDDRVYFQGCYNIDRLKQPSCTIKQFELDITTGERLSEEREIWGGHARYDTEGPHIYKVDGWYYLLVAEGGTFEHHMLCIGRSKDIWGPYEDYLENPILTADGEDEYIQNAGHGELFQDGSGQWWAVALAVRNENQGNVLGTGEFLSLLGRETFLTPVEWPKNGWPRIEQPKIEFQAKPVESLAGGEAEFKSPPNVADVYIRTPDLSKYNVPEDEKGRISLYPSVEGFSEPHGTCSFLGRRQLWLNSVSTASLDITTLSPDIKAGLALYKDNLRHASLSYNSTDRKVSCQVVILDSEKTLTGELEIHAAEKEVQFRIASHPTKWDFFAKAASHDAWTGMGSVSAREFSAREMTGPIFGVFARTESGGTDLPVIFHGFDVEN